MAGSRHGCIQELEGYLLAGLCLYQSISSVCFCFSGSIHMTGLFLPGLASLGEQKHPSPKIHRLTWRNMIGPVWVTCPLLELHHQEVGTLWLAILDHMTSFQGQERHDWQPHPEPRSVVWFEKECCEQNGHSHPPLAIMTPEWILREGDGQNTTAPLWSSRRFHYTLLISHVHTLTFSHFTLSADLENNPSA